MEVESSFAAKPRVYGLAERLAEVGAFDLPAGRLAKLSARQRGPLADLARGQPLGHPLHPALTDLPIGFWTSSLLLDLVGGRRFAARRAPSLALESISAVPTVVAGAASAAAATNPVASATIATSLRFGGRRGGGPAGRGTRTLTVVGASTRTSADEPLTVPPAGPAARDARRRTGVAGFGAFCPEALSSVITLGSSIRSNQFSAGASLSAPGA